MTVHQVKSDALVFFGATGDLAYKKIFPALQGMIKRGTLTMPVIGVPKSGSELAGGSSSRESTGRGQFAHGSCGAHFYQKIDEGADLEG